VRCHDVGRELELEIDKLLPREMKRGILQGDVVDLFSELAPLSGRLRDPVCLEQRVERVQEVFDVLERVTQIARDPHELPAADVRDQAVNQREALNEPKQAKCRAERLQERVAQNRGVENDEHG
jgi:hypothetical protein